MKRASPNRLSQPSPAVRSATWMMGIVIALTGIGFALRLRAGLGEFWLDEIMSLGLAITSKSALSIFQQRVDNNHLLNTVLMHVMGEQRWWPVYRIPAMLAGAGTLVIGGMIGRRWGRVEAIIAMLLLCFSYPLIHFGSEARGYSLVIFFSVAAFLCMDAYLRQQKLTTAVLFWLTCILGLLAHPLFVQVYLALLGWSVFRVARTRSGWKTSLLTLGQCHLVPFLAVAALYAFFLRGMTVVGGEITPLWDIVARTASLTLGTPARATTAWTVFASVMAAVLFGCGLFLLWRRGDDRWVFFALAILVAPAAIIVVRRPDVLYERYFLLPMTFLLMLGAYVLGALMRARTAGMLTAVAALAAFMISNGLSTARLISEGRGHYMEALRFIRDHSTNSPIAVTSDHDFRNQVVMGFYWRYVQDGRPIDYVSTERGKVEGAQWLITHEFDPDAKPFPAWADNNGHEYQLAASYGYAGLSGWQWFVYRNPNWQRGPDAPP